MEVYHTRTAKVHRFHSPPPTWAPGQSVPPRNSGVEPDALEALRRHAVAHARHLEEQAERQHRQQRRAA